MMERILYQNRVWLYSDEAREFHFNNPYVKLLCAILPETPDSEIKWEFWEEYKGFFENYIYRKKYD
jgi:hypothetical protein